MRKVRKKRVEDPVISIRVPMEMISELERIGSGKCRSAKIRSIVRAVLEAYPGEKSMDTIITDISKAGEMRQ